MRKIGISAGGLCRLYGIERGLEICKESGFDAVDFNLEMFKLGDEVYGGSEDAFESYFNGIRRKAEDLELIISQTHGRCATYKPEPESREWAHKISERDLKATSILGAPACVIHFPNSTRWGKQTPAFMHEMTSELFGNLIPYAEKYKTAIALETFGAARVAGERIRDFFADPDAFLTQYNGMNTEYKTICVDTGHTHEAESFWVPPPEEMIRILGSDISLLHLHDNTGHWDDHLLPGFGNINWPAVFEALEEVGYSGVYNFELRLSLGRAMVEEFTHFAGKYLRYFVNNNGKIK